MVGDIVHIGYHKTATNWFQRVFYPHARNYRYINRKRVRDAFIEDGAFGFDPDHALKKIGKDNGERIILCEEELSGNLHNGGLFGCFSKEIAGRLRQVLPEAQVVIFIRSQPEMIASVYKQYVKEGGTHSINRYLHHGRYLPRSGFRNASAAFFSFDHFDYSPLIHYYRELFGAGQVHVFPYEQFCADSADFIRGYIERFGLDIEQEPVSTKRVNIGYRAGTLLLARFLNHFTLQDVVDKRYWINLPGFYKASRSLLKRINYLPLLGASQGADEILGGRNMAFIRERYAESNRRLVTELGLPLEQYGYPLTEN